MEPSGLTHSLHAGTIAHPSVIIYLKLSTRMGSGGESFALHEIEDAVRSAVTAVGNVDNNEIGGGYYAIFVYGSDAKTIFEAARPALVGPLIRPGSYALLQESTGGKLIERVELSGTMFTSTRR